MLEVLNTSDNYQLLLWHLSLRKVNLMYELSYEKLSDELLVD